MIATQLEITCLAPLCFDAGGKGCTDGIICDSHQLLRCLGRTVCNLLPGALSRI
jgi:hypothetical protein